MDQYSIMVRGIMQSGIAAGKCNSASIPRLFPGCPRTMDTEGKVANKPVPHECLTQTWDMKLYLVQDNLSEDTLAEINKESSKSLGGVEQMVLSFGDKARNIGDTGMMWLLATYDKVRNTFKIYHSYRTMYYWLSNGVRKLNVIQFKI